MACTDRAADGSTVRINGPSELVCDGVPLGMSSFSVAVEAGTWDIFWAADFGVDPQIRQFDGAWNLVVTQGFANPFAADDLRDQLNLANGHRAKLGDPMPFNIHVLNGRALVMYCNSQLLKNEAGFIADTRQFFASEEDSLDAETEDESGGFQNRGRRVEAGAARRDHFLTNKP